MNRQAPMTYIAVRAMVLGVVDLVGIQLNEAAQFVRKVVTNWRSAANLNDLSGCIRDLHAQSGKPPP